MFRVPRRERRRFGRLPAALGSNVVQCRSGNAPFEHDGGVRALQHATKRSRIADRSRSIRRGRLCPEPSAPEISRRASDLVSRAARQVFLAPLLRGLVLCVAVAAVAFLLGRLMPVVGGPVFGILLGALLATLRPPSAQAAPGIRFAGKQLLQLSIVLLG